IPSGEYGAGNVIVWDCGVYSPDEDQQYFFGDREQAQARIREGLAEGKLSFFLRGEKLKGSFALVRTRESKQWLLIKHKDRFVSQGSDVLARRESVLSGVALDDPAKVGEVERIDASRLTPSGNPEPMPQKLAPMLAEIGDLAEHVGPRAGAAGSRWLYEPKLDGYRVIAYIRDKDVRLESRRGLNLTQMFPEVVEELAQQCAHSMVL